MNHLQLVRCNFFIVINGVSYELEDVDSDILDNPQRYALTRGMNGKNMIGISYAMNMNQPFTRTLTCKNVRVELVNLLRDCFKNGRFIDEISTIDRVSGDYRKTYNNILIQDVRQTNIQDNEDSLNIEIVVNTFNVDDKLAD